LERGSGAALIDQSKGNGMAWHTKQERRNNESRMNKWVCNHIASMNHHPLASTYNQPDRKKPRGYRRDNWVAPIHVYKLNDDPQQQAECQKLKLNCAHWFRWHLWLDDLSIAINNPTSTITLMLYAYLPFYFKMYPSINRINLVSILWKIIYISTNCCK